MIADVAYGPGDLEKMAETIAANRGLGYMMNRAASDFDVELVFTGLLTLAAIVTRKRVKQSLVTLAPRFSAACTR